MVYNYKTMNRNTKPSTKQKRWYVDAQIAKTVPLIGGSSFKAGSGPLTKRSLQTLIRETNESKQKIIVATNTSGLLHNTIYTYNPLGNIPIGTGANSRIGQDIFVKNIRLEGLLTNVGGVASMEVHFRVMVVSSNSQTLSGSDALSSGLGSTDIFVQGSNYLIDSIPDNNRCTVLHDSHHKLIPQGSGSTTQSRISLNFGKGKVLKYLTPTSNYATNKNIYVVVIPYYCGGTTGTTVIGSIQWESVVDFTDA